MNKLITIVFNAYLSDYSLSKVLPSLNNFNVIIIENSKNLDLKNKLEKKYKNVNVVIPSKNLGLAAGYNLGIKKSKTKYVFLNAPDIKITKTAINKLINLAEKIKNFGIISPIYDDESIHRNYSVYQRKVTPTISSVNWIDNNYLVNRKKIKSYLFDENYFLYFENFDFCLNLKRKKQLLYVAKKIKFKHYWSKSVDLKHAKIVQFTRAFHYNWSKFYFYKKNYSYFYALTKISPNFYQAFKNVIRSIININFFNLKLHMIEIYGILSAVLLIKSFYRAKK